MSVEMTKLGVFDCQVCAPEDFTDAQAVAFAEEKFPCGTQAGWTIRRAGDKSLNGCAERVPCASRPRHVHIMLDA
jgi:hypothetical protein